MILSRIRPFIFTSLTVPLKHDMTGIKGQQVCSYAHHLKQAQAQEPHRNFSTSRKNGYSKRDFSNLATDSIIIITMVAIWDLGFFLTSKSHQQRHSHKKPIAIDAKLLPKQLKGKT